MEKLNQKINEHKKKLEAQISQQQADLLVAKCQKLRASICVNIDALKKELGQLLNASIPYGVHRS